ncbi:MAG: AAA family ATPase [Desulfobacterales bacterium]|nr:AAA family ATPase [Desulfobacterales bacterium]
MKQIPYGNSNFESVMTENYYFIDKTSYIEELEKLGSKYLFFLRPRRFGKSLFLSMLEHYYDINRKEQFNILFKGTYISKNPTPLKNSYPILKFNFSMIGVSGTINDIEKRFFSYIYGICENFLRDYKNIFESVVLKPEEKYSGASDVLTNVLKLTKGGNFYLMIDEYDNFANNILIEHGQDSYMSVTHAGGFLRSFFAIIKGGTETKTIDRIFVTGVSPLLLADVTSGFNIGTNISMWEEFSEMIGVNYNELSDIIEYYISENRINLENKNKVISEIINWYNGYLFNYKLKKVCNTDMVLYFMEEYIKKEELPYNMLDDNVRTDYAKIKYLILLNNKLNGNFDILREVSEKEETSCELVTSFAIAEQIDKKKFTSLLYYLGLITISSKIGNSFIFKIPNRVIKGLIWEFIVKSIEDAYKLRVDSFNLDKFFRNLAFKGEWQELFSYLLGKFYEASSIRDFIYREEGVKGFLLAYLNMTSLFKVYSEPEFNKGFADIYLEADNRFPEIKSGFLIELKYLKAKKISKTMIDKDFEQAKEQLAQYAVDKKVVSGTRKIVIVLSAKKVLKIEEI